MAAKVLNIEIGDRLAKVCQSNKLGKNYQIKESFIFQVPDQYVNDGQIMNPTALGLLLKETLAAHGITNVKNATFTLTSSKIASREVLLPPVKEKLIKSVVETNAPDYFPVDLSNYQIAFNVLERVQQPENGYRVLVMAAPKPLLMGYARLADEADLILDNLDYAGNSQYQVLRSIQDKDAVMYVDVNINSTMVSFIQNGVLLLQRSFGFGGDELVFAAQRAAGLSDTEYLQTLKKAADPQWLDTLLPEEEQANCLTRLIGGIARSADFFKSSRTNSPITQVVLIGTCCQIAGLKERIAKALEKETVLLTSVSGVQFLADSIEGVSSFISCIGSLLSPLDLMPEELRRKKRAQKTRSKNPDSINLGIGVCAACTALAVLLSGFSVIHYLQVVGQRNKMQTRIDELAEVAKVHDTYLEYQSMTDNLQVVAGYADTPNAQLEAFFQELEQKMPSSVLLLSAACSTDGVTMNITTPGMEEAAVVISQLRSFESIVSMTVSTITEAVDDTGYPTASFSVSCGYNAAPTDENGQTVDDQTATDQETAAQADQSEPAQ